MANTLELLEQLNIEFTDIDKEFNDFLSDSTVNASSFNIFLKSLNAYSVDTNTTMEMMTGEDDKQKDYPNAIPVIDEVVDPIKDEVNKSTTIVNTNGEV